jgi:hypothetical protein
MALRAYYKTKGRVCLKTKPGILSASNLQLLKAAARKSPSYALRSALLRMAAHQEQLSLALK